MTGDQRIANGKVGDGTKRTKSQTRAEQQNIKLGARYVETAERIRLERTKTQDDFNIFQLRLKNEISDIRDTLTSGGSRMCVRDRHENMTEKEAARRVLRPLIFDAQYLNGSNKYALRRVYRFPDIVNKKTGKMLLPGNNNNQITRAEYGERESDTLKVARNVLRHMEQERATKKARSASIFKAARPKSEERGGKSELAFDHLSSNLSKMATELDLYASRIELDSRASSKRSASGRRTGRKRFFPATPENGQKLVDRATRKMHNFLEKLNPKPVEEEEKEEDPLSRLRHL